MTSAKTLAAIEPDWPAAANVKAFATTRAGGSSTGAYASLNLALHVGDEPERVAANRHRLIRELKLPAEPHWLEQVHGAGIADLDGAWSGPADGATTGRAGVVCAVMTADCLPVLLADRSGSRVGVAHAGWRGLARGVLPAAVAAMRVPPAELLAWLGPAIGPDAYEVGEDVLAACTAADPAARGAFTPNARGRWQADLYRLARSSLAGAGVTAVFGGRACTYSEPVRFFSHRREAPCGRMASMIWLIGDTHP